MDPNAPNRREFVLGTAGAVATAAVARARAAQAEPVPVDVAVIGTGARGCDLIRALSTIVGCRILAICDDYAPHLEQGSRYAGPAARTFDNHRRLLEDVKPQAVVVAVPLAEHHRIAADALAAGCDVFCEKMLCGTIDDARDIARRVADAKAVFQVGLQRRANPIYQQAAAMVRAGTLGRITAIKAQWHRNNNWRRPVPVPRTDSRWAELERRLNWRLYKATSAGLMAELGSHQIDVASWLLGSVPRRVFATGGVETWRDGRDVPDTVFCIYEYELPASARDREPAHRVRVTYSALCDNAYEGASELILGTRGSLFLTPTKGLYFREPVADDGRVSPGSVAVSLTAGKTLKMANSPWAHRGEPVEIDNDQGDDTRDELVSFLDHVRRRDPKTICDVEEGARNVATVLMANESMERGAFVGFPAPELDPSIGRSGA